MSEPRPGAVRPRIGKYTITGRIGRGGMGMVYRGWDEVLEREVAVKTLTVEKSLEDEHRQRFQIEAKAAAKLQHPNIVTVFELGEDRGLPFIAMELLSGVDLEALLRSGEAMLLAEKLDVMAQVCRGLHYAHERRIVHRDMKPSNIRVLEDGTAKIMDFGIAKLGATGVTKSGMMVGTVHYMSPEQIRGKALDGRSDVFSVGVILYQLLAGERPFAGDHPTEILYKIVHNEAPPLAVDLGECGPPLQAVLTRALAKDADQRHPNAATLADELLRIAAQNLRGSGATPADISESVSASRRLVVDGNLEEGVRRLREVTDRHPDSVEAQRALRFATQEMKRRALAPEETADEYPELAATFRPVPTQAQDAAVATTLLPPPPTVASAGPTVTDAPAPHDGALRRYGWIGVAAAAAVTVGVLLAVRPETPVAVQSPPSPGRPVVAPAGPTPAVRPVSRMTIKVTSDPTGASLAMDGQPVGVTPTSLSFDPSTPPRLTFSREGFHTREVRLEANNIPAEVRVGLETSGPQGSVALSSSYPVDVLWRGRQLATAEASKSFDLPAGEQSLTIVSKEHFLRATMTVEVRGGETVPLTPPVLGRINIRANPDNCQVFIDGTFVDYPPILNRPLAGGAHTVSFRWPDGVNRDEAVDVSPGSPAYVMGRRD
ncbi:MAG TPA: protein kinase [Vicinamibacteria bacterium]|nr:protein kinase [Vicinamibacteria bacterium]